MGVPRFQRCLPVPRRLKCPVTYAKLLLEVTLILISGKLQNKYGGGPVGGTLGIRGLLLPDGGLMPPSVKERALQLLLLLPATLCDWYLFGHSGLQSLAASSGAEQLITRERLEVKGDQKAFSTH
ncbi:unnamed protein product [Leuciscus chuanchicus]